MDRFANGYLNIVDTVATTPKNVDLYSPLDFIAYHSTSFYILGAAAVCYAGYRIARRYGWLDSNN